MARTLAFFRKHRKKLLVALCVVAVLGGADFWVGKRQADILRAAQEKKDRLERLAFFMVFPDIHDAFDVKGKAGEYDAVIKVGNVSDERIFTTRPRVTTYVQTGTFWTEVPVREKTEGESRQVSAMKPGTEYYSWTLTIPKDIPYTEYNMYGYMHVRFHISLHVLPESMFNEEEVLERYTDVYIYLKPFFITDREILAQVDFADGNVPVMIPMPPH